MMSAESAAVASYIAISVFLAPRVLRADVFFGLFFLMLIVYSAFSQIGYLLYPEVSEHVFAMYFGPEILLHASVFSALSILSVYFFFRRLYLPVTRRVSIVARELRPNPIVYLSATSLHVILLGWGLWAYASDLSYFNASDEEFLAAVGLNYQLFWFLFKATPFTLLALYAFFRSKADVARRHRVVGTFLLCVKLAIFLAIVAATGNRADPLALALGIFGFEYYSRFGAPPGSAPTQTVGAYRFKKSRRNFLVGSAGALTIVVVLLLVLESSRFQGDQEIDVPLLAQVLLLKDYYAPFHVLVGAMAFNYVEPFTVLQSNAANMLMFLKVNLLQQTVVDLWNPGSATRAASPALFVFTEGYVFAGWLGAIYNGLVFGLGLTVWRVMANSKDHVMNALVYGLAIALLATTVRSQTAFFLKNTYLFVLPAMFLYSIALGFVPIGIARCSAMRGRVDQVDWRA